MYRSSGLINDVAVDTEGNTWTAEVDFVNSESVGRLIRLVDGTPTELPLSMPLSWIEGIASVPAGAAMPNLTPYQPPGWSDKIVVSTTTGTNTDSSTLTSADALYIDWAAINGGATATTATFYVDLYVDGVVRATFSSSPPLGPSNYVSQVDYSIGSLSPGTHHGRFRIANEDFLYALSTFVFEPIRFNARFGWRALTEAEKLAMFHFWRAVGHRMGINDIPETPAALEAYNLAYERDRFRLTEAGREVGAATRELFARWFPRPLRPLIRQAIYALLDDRTRQAFGFPAAPRWWEAWSCRRSRCARVLRWMPRRRQPLLRTARPTPTYPRGYRIGQLGP